MTNKNLAHLRFADDVYAAVCALQRVRPVQAKDAREIYADAPEGWYVVVMTLDRPGDLVAVVGEAMIDSETFDIGLMNAKIEREGDKCVAVFFNLRGLEQSVH